MGVLSTADRKIEQDQINITIDGVVYDVTNFVNFHPGGDVITKYNNKNATDAFFALHGEEAIKKLPNFKAKDQSKVVEPTEQSKKFQAFRKKMLESGLMDVNPIWWIYKTITTLAFLYFGAYLVFQDYSMLGAIFMGIGWQQLGWLGHEYGHHQIFKNRKLNRLMGYFVGNISQGFSVTWWNDRHNTHHAITNVLDSDPDIDNLPIFAWSEHDIPRMSPFLKSHVIIYQQYYFLLFCPFLRLIWALQSVVFVTTLSKAPNKKYASYSKVELATILIHWAWSLFVLYNAKHRVWFFMISQGLPGFGIAIIVFFNHYACEHYKDNDQEFDFVDLVFKTTRNMKPSTITDWICGGLNYQIEHHLFPTLPRHNLTKARVLVKQFCKENNIEYQEADFIEGVGYIHQQLASVSRKIQKMNAHSD